LDFFRRLSRKPRLTQGQRRITALKEKREAKAEKERYEKMAAKMHQKRVDRLKRREKRNKMLKS
jgi:rRNA-processing protein CGR1